MNYPRSFVYASLGNQLEVFEINRALDSLTFVQSVEFQEVVQYAWPNRARTMLYVISSGSGPMAEFGVPNHFAQAFRILQNGSLEPVQTPLRLGNRPLFVSLDREEKHVLIAYNDPSDVTVHRIGAGGEIGEQVLQQALDFGATVHQVRVTPHGNMAIVPACAHHPEGVLAGHVDIFDYENGRLLPHARIKGDPRNAEKWRGVTHGAQGFSPRHVDFHPTQPWMYMAVETQGELHLYDYDEMGVALEPRFIKSTLEELPVGRSAQMVGAIHIHPNGRYLYVTNRAWEAEPEEGVDVFVGGANTIAVFELDQSSGEPKLIQQVDTLGIFPRTFGMDIQGRVLVVGNEKPSFIRTGDTITRVVPNLVMFKIDQDGRLERILLRDFPDNGKVCFWSTVLTLSDGNQALTTDV